MCDGSPLRLNVTCSSTSIDVAPEVCSGPDPAYQPSLLQVAVRCFTGTQQARYTDRHGFAFENIDDVMTFDADQSLSEHYDYSDLIESDTLDDCGDDYIAAARWLLGGTQSPAQQVQAQCSPGGDAVPDCVAPGPLAQADIGQRLRLYSLISPLGARPEGDSCFDDDFGDISLMELRSLVPDRAFHSILAGRYLCSQEEVSGQPGSPLVACNDALPTTGPGGCRDHVDCSSGECTGNACDLGTCDGGTCGLVSGVNLDAGGALAVEINGGENFDNCCDREVPTEPGTGGCSSTDPNCSPWDIQCTTAAMFGDCDAADCTVPGVVFTPYRPVIWIGPVVDVDVGNHQTKTPSDEHVRNACLRFSFLGSFPDAPGIVPHLFGPAVRPAPVVDGCAVEGNTRTDIDADGIYDVCDPVVGSRGPADGTGRLVLRNKVRNEGPYPEPFNAATNVVTIGGEPATIDPMGSNDFRLDVAVPELTGIPPVEGYQIRWKPNAGEAEPIWAPDPFDPLAYGYVSDGRPGGLLVMDQVAEAVVDGNASPTNSYVNLNCDPADDVTEVSAPVDLAVRPGPSPAYPGVTADREVYVLSDVMAGDPPQPGSRLFGFGVDDHRLLGDTAGVVIPGSARALALAEDAPEGQGAWHAYVAWTLLEGFGKLSWVDLDTGGRVDGSMFINGTPLDLEVAYVGSADKIYAYVSSFVCIGEGGGLGPQGNPPICIECSGGGPTPPSRQLRLTVIDVTDPYAMSEVAGMQINRTEPPCSERLPLDNLGLAFNEDRSLLHVVDPDGDRLLTLDTATNAFVSSMDLPVDSEPVDVAVVKPGGTGNERVYVVGHGDHFLYVSDGFSILSELNLAEPGDPEEALLRPVALATRSDGLRVFTANNLHETITIVNIDPGIPNPVRVKDVGTDGPARRLALLNLPAD